MGRAAGRAHHKSNRIGPTREWGKGGGKKGAQAMTMLSPPAESPTLSTEEADRFREQGFLGPFRLCSPEEMDRIRPEVERVLETDPPDHNKHVHNRHLDTGVVHELATHPAIVERMAALYGDNLLLWRTNFFTKEPGGLEVPWHQDFNYWPLEPPMICSAWLAIDPATVENSCVQIIPGSHRKVAPHVPASEDMLFKEMVDPKWADESQAVDMELEPGQFFLFNERTLHHSHPNNSDKRRIGLAVRVIPPMVKVLNRDSPNHGLVQIHGEDPMGLNRKAHELG
jgi:hypothetical protein